MKRSAAHRAAETPDWLWFILDRHAIDIWNNYITHADATVPPAETVTGRRSCPTHLHTFFAEARLSNVSQAKPNPHKGDDTRICAYYVGRHRNGAYFFDPISGNIIFSAKGHYKIVDDLPATRPKPITALAKFRAAPQIFPKPSFRIPAKTNALSAGLIQSSDTSGQEQRTQKSKSIRKSQKSLLVSMKAHQKTLKGAKNDTK